MTLGFLYLAAIVLYALIGLLRASRYLNLLMSGKK